jgi:hypothetical protein
MPRKTKYAGQDPSTPGGRVEFVLREIYLGDQSQMAAETGMSQPQISLVVRGERSPGAKMLSALAKDPRLNRRWVLEGIGEPLAASGTVDQPVDRRNLPVASCLLPVSPQVNAGMLSGATFSVAESFCKKSRYFYKVQNTDPAVRAGLDIKANDLLLFETDPSYWRPNLNVLLDKLCAIRLRFHFGTVCMLARAKPVSGQHELNFEVLGGSFERDADQPKLYNKFTIKYDIRNGRCIEVEQTQDESQPSESVPHVVADEREAQLPSAIRPTSPSADETQHARSSPVGSAPPSVDDVAGLCLLLVRTDLF